MTLIQRRKRIWTKEKTVLMEEMILTEEEVVTQQMQITMKKAGQPAEIVKPATIPISIPSFFDLILRGSNPVLIF